MSLVPRRAARVASLLLAGALTAPGACAPVPAGDVSGLAPPHAYWRAGDRILVTDFRELGAVTSDRRFVYAAGEQGVLVYDHRQRRWQSPLTLEDGFPRADRAIALEVDEFTGVLWMVTSTGALWAHDVPLGGEWRRVGTLPGAPPVRLVTHEGSLWAQTSSGWFESSGGGMPPMRAGSVPEAVQSAPAAGLLELERESAAFRSTGSSLTVDEYMRRWEITGAAPSPDPGRWWLSTWGGGLYAYDDRMLEAQPLRFGSVGRGVSAIALGGGGAGRAPGFWFGGDGLGRYRGVARSDAELQNWTWHEAGREGAPGGPVHDIVETDAGVFVGGQDGLFRLIGERWDRLTDSDALPSTTVRALATAGGALWAGTDRGLVRIVAEGGGGLAVLRIDGTSGSRINALAAADSLLWLATDRGLWHLDLATGALSQPPIDDPRLRGRIVGVAFAEGILYALAESTLLAYDGATWSTPLLGASIGGIGRPTHVAARAGIVWVSGTAGAIALDPIDGAETLLTVPRDIPEGPVRQALPIPGGVWLATPAGALLIQLQ